MIRLLYVSTLDADVTANELDEIITQAAVRNAKLGITGLLAIEGRRVCQILEGDEGTVSALYETIARDQRHRAVIEIDRRPIQQRGYPQWSMVRRPMIDMVLAALPG